MDWINDMNIFMGFYETFDCAKHVLHIFAYIFPSMCCHKYETFVLYLIKEWVSIIFPHCRLKCINRCIACHENALFIFVFRKQMLAGLFCWCKMNISHNPYKLAVY